VELGEKVYAREFGQRVMWVIQQKLREERHPRTVSTPDPPLLFRMRKEKKFLREKVNDGEKKRTAFANWD